MLKKLVCVIAISIIFSTSLCTFGFENIPSDTPINPHETQHDLFNKGLIAAAQKNDTTTVAHLLDLNRKSPGILNVNVQDSLGLSPIDHAMAHNNTDMQMLLFSEGAVNPQKSHTNNTPSISNNQDFRPQHTNYSGLFENILIPSDTPINSHKTYNDLFNEQLVAATQANNPATVRFLLEILQQYPDKLHINEVGFTTIDIAAQRNYMDILYLLLTSGTK